MTRQPIDHRALLYALRQRDLTDPATGPHAIQRLVSIIHTALATTWRCGRIIHPGPRLVPVADNYDALGYPPDGAARDARYTRYVDTHWMLRSQMSAVIPTLLRSLALDPPHDVLLVCPGMVYRRDSIDRLHVGEPHQLELWRICASPQDGASLRRMVAIVLEAALPAYTWRVVDADHPYTTGGLQIDVDVSGTWVEVGECGIAAPHVLHRAGIDPSLRSGLAMGLGLDRLLMLRKGIDDIRLLRADDPRVVDQMLDLAPYRPVSRQPAIIRDISIAVAADADGEALGDRVRTALGDAADALEAVEIVSEAGWSVLPCAARDRLGLRPGQKNVLVRLTLRHPVRTLTRAEANALRNRVYDAVHVGSKRVYAGN
jgi:phenylalanyl-tRNA synthetase alpha chain